MLESWFGRVGLKPMEGGMRQGICTVSKSRIDRGIVCILISLDTDTIEIIRSLRGGEPEFDKR